MEHPYAHILLVAIKQIREGSLSSDFEYKGELIIFLLLNFETLDVDELPLLIIKDKLLEAIKAGLKLNGIVENVYI